MKIEYFRPYGDAEVKLCEHISIMGRRTSKNDQKGCEYESNWRIICKICNIVHEINELIN